MNPKDFLSQAAGTPISTQTGYWAFLPAPLPPTINWSLPLVTALAEAERALSKLATLAGTLPLPWLLIRPCLHREALFSSRIEGLPASLTELYAWESARTSLLKPGSAVREVHNLVLAQEYGLERLKSLPISLRLLRESHAKLMQGPNNQTAAPGEFRQTQNWIGAPGSTPLTAKYVPPPVEEMKIGLDRLENYIHSPSEIPALVRAGLVHYQFEALHPFLDGNGRIGRLLINLLLTEWDLLPLPLLCPSVYFEQYRQEYHTQLLSVSQKGDWEAWLRFFLRGMSTQANESLAILERLQTIRIRYESLAQTDRQTRRMEQVLDFLFMQPIFSVRQLQAFLGVSFPIAQGYIDKLLDAGVLQELTGQARNRLFRASEIFQTLEKLQE